MNLKHRILPLAALAAGIVLALAGPRAADAQEGKLQIGSTVNLKIAGVPANDVSLVSGAYAVGGDGSLNLPYLDSGIQAVGLTRSELERKIEAAYKAAEIYTKPTIIIYTEAGDPNQGAIVSVGGEVNRPGSVPFRPGMTMLQALTDAGGKTDFGNLKEVVLLRDGKTTTYDLSKVGNAGSSLKLKPNDQIVVRPRGLLPFGN